MATKQDLRQVQYIVTPAVKVDAINAMAQVQRKGPLAMATAAYQVLAPAAGAFDCVLAHPFGGYTITILEIEVLRTFEINKAGDAGVIWHPTI